MLGVDQARVRMVLPAHDERNADRLLVQDRFLVPPVGPKPITVIAGEDDQRLRLQAFDIQRIEDSPDFGVDPFDQPVVGVAVVTPVVIGQACSAEDAAWTRRTLGADGLRLIGRNGVVGRQVSLDSPSAQATLTATGLRTS